MTTTKNRSRMTGGALLVAVLSLAAACGNDSTSQTAAAQQDVVPIAPADGAGEDTAGGDATADNTTGTSADGGATGGGGDQTYTQAEAQQAYREYVSCLQDAGVPVAPAAFTVDGTIDIDAELAYWDSLSEDDLAVFNDDSVDYDSIDLACRPENAEALYALIAPDESRVQELETDAVAEFETQMADLARCMRQTFPEFPDPVLPDLTNLGDEADVEIDPFPGISLDDPIYGDALRDCAVELGIDTGAEPGADS